jgi:hypothetical protein
VASQKTAPPKSDKALASSGKYQVAELPGPTLDFVIVTLAPPAAGSVFALTILQVMSLATDPTLATWMPVIQSLLGFLLKANGHTALLVKPAGAAPKLE